MKVLQIFNVYLEKGGEENSVERMARHLEYGGHTVIRYRRKSIEFASTSRTRACILGLWNFEVLKEIREIHEREAPDVWLLHNVIPVVSLGVYQLARQLNAPVIQWLHNYRPLSLSGTDEHFGLIGRLRECLRGGWRGSRASSVWLCFGFLMCRTLGAYRHVSAWVAVSRDMRETFRIEGWYPEKLYVCEHSWDIEPVMPEESDKCYFLFLGRIEEIKGVSMLIELFRSPALKDIELRIAGTGSLESLAGSSSSNVKWLGMVTGKSKRRLIRNSRAMLFPSLWREPLSTIAYECYEQARPMIVSDSGGMREVAENGVTGFVLKPGDVEAWEARILKLANDPKLAESLGRKARAWLDENVSPEKWNERFEKIARTALTA